MTEKIKEGDFVELDFIGRIKSTGQLFDLTVEDVAKKEGINGREFKPLVACVKAKHLLEGFDEQLVGRADGEEFEFDIKPEKAFGKKNPKLIQLSSIQSLKRTGVNPVPGMQLDIDGAIATVRSVTGGRVVLDFNHPLAGKELHYWVKIRKMVTDSEEKANAVAHMIGAPCKITVKNKIAEIKLEKESTPEQKEFLSEEIKKLVPEVKINFV